MNAEKLLFNWQLGRDWVQKDMFMFSFYTRGRLLIKRTKMICCFYLFLLNKLKKTCFKKQLFFYNKVIELFYLYTPENYYYNTDENDVIDPYKLREAILERFGSEFYMSCKTDKVTGKKYVVKLRVPLDKEFNLIKDYKQEKSNCF